MKTSKLLLIFFTILLLLPIVNAGVEEEQLSSLINQIKDRILGVQVKNKPCLNNALQVLKYRMDEMTGAQAFFRGITDPVIWARQLIGFRIDLAISALEKLKGDVDDYINEGRPIITAEYRPGWGRWTFGDECKPFNLQFLWLKDLNIVRVIASGDCKCTNDLKDFYIQFDVQVRVNERINNPQARNRYQIIGFEDVEPYEYLPDEEESKSIIKVNCCKNCGNEINWESEEESEESKEVGFSTPRKELFADPDEFLAALETGKFVLSQKQREDFMSETLCTRIDVLPRPTPTRIPDFTRTPTPTKTPDFTKTPAPDPTRTPKPTLPPILPTLTPTITPTPTLPPVISTKTPTLTPTQTPIDCIQVCASKGWNTQKSDFSSYIFSTVNQYQCVSGAKITQPGSYKVGPCTCYDPNEKPKIEIDTRIPFCKNTFCGDVPCGEKRTCQEPGAAYSAECRWEGWKMGESGLPTPSLDVY
jgi:hypothetical protein